ncbi:hypothetical protein K435DRAFT_432187 [Dendrothele bispora CBS 962.96]|uniref:F-box domain-containing protein n=1 Tax=Dendrothele bispora (strain CBS 962.96) TaxID=1314807 RepID=A0A4S8L444_DENBC|nr:hypothetical protein K435DRAFT_432187 [Dendrothele bispora CBS 962.96]
MPCLEYLRLPAGVLMEGWSPALPIYQAPRLCHLEINSAQTMSPHLPRDFGSPVFQQFPWTQITTFELSKLHVLDLWKLLDRCNHLSELTVCEVECSNSSLLSSNLAASRHYLDLVNRQEPITLPCLSSIDIQFEYSVELDCGLTVLFSKLTAPALRHLTVSISDPPNGKIQEPRMTWPLDVFNSFVARSTVHNSGLFTLSSLCIKLPITAFNLLSVLDCLSCLTELEITEHSDAYTPDSEERLICDEFLYGLCISQTNVGPLFGAELRLPRLLHLCLRMGCRRATFTTEALHEMVRSRWIPDPTCASALGVACLHSIKVVGDGREGEQALGYEPLRELERLGLQVEIIP